MEIITESIRQQLVENFNTNRERQERGQPELDHHPVVKLFTPDACCTWLLSELDPETDMAFGICDLCLGYPEIGYVSVDELRRLRGALGLPVERDLHFEAKMTLMEYAMEAVKAERIVT